MCMWFDALFAKLNITATHLKNLVLPGFWFFPQAERPVLVKIGKNNWLPFG